MDFLAPMNPQDVTDEKTLAAFAQQRMGVPLPRLKDYPAVRKQIKAIFDQNPKADWQTMVKVVMWGASKRRRYAHLRQLVANYRQAWADGCLPELEPSYIDPSLSDEIDKALAVEKDSEWRTKLIRAKGHSNKEAVLRAWKATQSSPSLAS